MDYMTTKERSMTKRTISADDVIGWNPCGGYTHDRIRELLPEPVAPLDVCDLRRFRGVSVEDRLWVLLRSEILGERELRLFACGCAERALSREREAGREPDAHSWEVVAVSRRYADGEATADALEVAWDAARNAAWNAWNAARAAGAAGAAAWDAAWDAEERWQLKRVAHYLREKP